MDTITKNTRKTLLATVVVAMLALVAVAGVVTYADDSAASSSDTSYTYMQGDVTVSSATASTDFFIYGSGTVTVPADVSYTGTVSFGYYSAQSGIAMAYDTVSFTGLTDASIDYDAGANSVVVNTGSSSATVDAAVTLGAVTFGSTGTVDGTVDATVTAADATVTLADSANLAVAVSDGKAYLSSTGVSGKVTVSGTAYEYGTLSIAEGATFTVADGAAVTTAYTISKPTYSFTVSYNAVTTLTSAVLSTDPELTGVINSTAKTVTFYNVPSGNYTLTMTFATPVTHGTQYDKYSYDVAVYDGIYSVAPNYTVTAGSGTAAYVAADSTATATPTYAYYTFTVATSNTGLTSDMVTLYKSDAKTGMNSGDGAGADYHVTVAKGIVTLYVAANITNFADHSTGTFYLQVADNATLSSATYAILEKLVITPTYSSTTESFFDGTFVASAVDTVTNVTNGLATANNAGVITANIVVDTDTTEAYLVNDGVLVSTATFVENGSTKYAVFANVPVINDQKYQLFVNDGTNYNESNISVTVSNDTATLEITGSADSTFKPAFTATSSSAITNIYVSALGDTVSQSLTVSASNYRVFLGANAGALTYEITANTTTSSAYANGSEYAHVTVTLNDGQTVVCEYIIVAGESTTPTVTAENNLIVIDAATSVSATGSAVAAVISNSGTLNVNGSLAVIYDSTYKGYSTISNAYTINAFDGTLTVQTGSSDYAPLGGTVNAAWFRSGSAAPYTYTFTGLAAALSEAKNVTVIGTLTLTEDLAVPAGTTATKVTLTVASGAELNIGNTDSAAVLTVPASTTNTFTTTGTDSVKVVNGSVRIAGETADRGDSIAAAVFMTDGTYGIYTDLNTALAAATDGTVTLRDDASVITNATVAVGVTLDLNSKNVTIGSVDKGGKATSTPTFTVDGILTGTSGMIVIMAGASAIANVSDTSSDAYAYVINGGALTVGKDATFNYVDVHAIDGTFTVDGTYLATFDNNATSYGIDNLINNGEGIGYPNKDSAVSLTIAVNGKMTLNTTGLLIGAKDTLTVNVSGELDINGTIINSGTVTATVASSGKVVAADDFVVVNVMGTLTIADAGTMSAADGKAFIVINKAPSTSKGKATVAVTGTGVFSANVFDVTGNMTVTVSDNAHFVPEVSDACGKALETAHILSESDYSAYADTYDVAAVVGSVVATDSAAVGSADNLVYVTSELVVGTQPTAVGETTDSVTAYAVLVSGTYDSIGGNAYAIVYGTAKNVTVTAVTISGDGTLSVSSEGAAETALYTVGTNANYLYATEYAVSINAYLSGINPEYFILSNALVLDTISGITGYTFLGWYTAASNGTVVPSATAIGEYSSIYALFDPQIYTVTFGYTEGAVYLVNGAQTASGQYTYAYGTELTVTLKALDGYYTDLAVLTCGAQSGPSVVIDVTANAAVGVTGVNKDPTLTLASYSGVQWYLDGVAVSGTVTLDYGSTYGISAVAAAGYSGTPVIAVSNVTLTGGSFTAGVSSMTATESGIIANPTISFAYEEGTIWLLDGVAVSGTVSLEVGSTHTLAAVAATGYSGTADVTLTGATLSSGSFTVGTSNMAANAGTGITPDPVDNSMTVTDYLLIVLVVITAVVAIAVVMRLIRK